MKIIVCEIKGFSYLFFFSACNVTIHNRCRDTLPNCVKMKQKVGYQCTHVSHGVTWTTDIQTLALIHGRMEKKCIEIGSVFLMWFMQKSKNVIYVSQQQQKMALMRNNSAYQNVTLRNKGEDVMETSVFLHLVLTSDPITSGICLL